MIDNKEKDNSDELMEEKFNTRNLVCTVTEIGSVSIYLLSKCCKYNYEINDCTFLCLFCKNEMYS